MMKFKALSLPLFLLLSACSEINSGWEVDGGGYIKYQINGGSSHTIGLDVDDVTLPSTNRHYISVTTQQDSSSRGDVIAFMIYQPTLGKNEVVSNYTYFVQEYGPKGAVIADSSYITLDETGAINDSIWTGNLYLYFIYCNQSTCDDTKTNYVTGRFRYWVDPDD